MAQVYSYKARNQIGKLVMGQLEAEGESAAVSALRQENLAIIDIRPVKKSAGNKKLDLNLVHFVEPKVSTKDLALFCRQFATMVEAGVPILSCLNVLGEQSGNKKLKKITAKIIEYLQSGYSLAESLQMHPDVFPPIFVNMVEAGELGGVLEQVLNNLAIHFEKEHDLKEKVKSAMMYPVVVSVVAFIVVTAMMVFVVPNYLSVIKQFHAELPASTKLIIAISNALQYNAHFILLSFLVLILLIKNLMKTEKGVEWYSRVSLKIPILGGILHRIIVARFCRTLATLGNSGVPILKALDVVKKATGNRLVVQAISDAESSIKEGQGIAQPLSRSGMFPPMVNRMVAVGEETGALEMLLEKAAIFYEREVDATVSRFASIIEPVLVVFMGGIVGFIVLSMFLPMLNIISSVQ